MLNHTPGPWKIHEKGESVTSTWKNQCPVDAIHIFGSDETFAFGRSVAATILEADAQLISKALPLLQLCRDVKRVINCRNAAIVGIPCGTTLIDSIKHEKEDWCDNCLLKSEAQAILMSLGE